MILEKTQTNEELEVRLRYTQEDRLFKRLLTFLQSVDKQLPCFDEKGDYQINVADIFYLESVDKKTFVYLEKQVYQTHQPLYRLLDDLTNDDFVRISKSCILNLAHLESVRPILNSRMEATLKNGEKVYVNRRYLPEMKRALKGDGS